MTVKEVWYRYEARSYASADEFDNVYVSSPELSLETFSVLSHTAKGVWLDVAFGHRRFVLSGARKRWACPTELEARESFIARKQRQISLLEAQLEKARISLALAETLSAPPAHHDPADVSLAALQEVAS